VFDLENIALEEDTPTDDNWNLAAFNPDEVPMVSLEQEWFTTEVVSKLHDGEVQSVSFLLEGVPVNGGAGVFVGSECDWLMDNSAVRVGKFLEKDSANSVVRGVGAYDPRQSVIRKMQGN
jgi:hypothetical protein